MKRQEESLKYIYHHYELFIFQEHLKVQIQSQNFILHQTALSYVIRIIRWCFYFILIERFCTAE